ncbi:hypothetical protein MTO96_020765 [Rhipicephalus appendiculatus]
MATGVLVSYPSPAQHEAVLSTLQERPGQLAFKDNCWDSVEDLAEQEVPTQGTDAVTLEDLKSLYNCCFTCGVSWAEDQVSLDCAECGGYALHRPCVQCNGSCGTVWRRDLVASHKLRRSQWIGECEKAPQDAAVAKSKDS